MARPEDCEMKLGQQGIEVCDKCNIYQLRKYLISLITNIQILANANTLSCISSEMAVHLDAIIDEDKGEDLMTILRKGVI